MGRFLFWLLIIILIVLVAGGIYVSTVDVPLEQRRVEQEVDREALGL